MYVQMMKGSVVVTSVKFPQVAQQLQKIIICMFAQWQLQFVILSDPS